MKKQFHFLALTVLMSANAAFAMRTTPLQLTRELDELTSLVSGSQTLAERFFATPHDQANLRELAERTKIINAKITTIEASQANSSGHPTDVAYERLTSRYCDIIAHTERYPHGEKNHPMALFHLSLIKAKDKFTYDKSIAEKECFLLKFSREIDELAELICIGDTAAKDYFAKPDNVIIERALEESTQEINAKTRSIEILLSLKGIELKYFKTSAYTRLSTILQNTIKFYTKPEVIAKLQWQERQDHPIAKFNLSLITGVQNLIPK